MKSTSLMSAHPTPTMEVIPTQLCAVANTKGWEFACGAEIAEGIIDYSKPPVSSGEALESAQQTKAQLCSKCEFCAACCSYAGFLTAGQVLALPAIFAPGLYS